METPNFFSSFKVLLVYEVSVRICCEDTEAAAVAPRLVCVVLKWNVSCKVNFELSQASASSGFFHLLVLSHFFLHKSTTPPATHTPYR